VECWWSVGIIANFTVSQQGQASKRTICLAGGCNHQGMYVEAMAAAACLQSTPTPVRQPEIDPPTTPLITLIDKRAGPCISSVIISHRIASIAAFAASVSDTTFFAAVHSVIHHHHHRHHIPSANAHSPALGRLYILPIAHTSFSSSHSPLCATSPHHRRFRRLPHPWARQSALGIRHHTHIPPSCLRRREAKCRVEQSKRSRHRTFLLVGNQHG